jgi:hypothetical protein
MGPANNISGSLSQEYVSISEELYRTFWSDKEAGLSTEVSAFLWDSPRAPDKRAPNAQNGVVGNASRQYFLMCRKICPFRELHAEEGVDAPSFF